MSLERRLGIDLARAELEADDQAKRAPLIQLGLFTASPSAVSTQTCLRYEAQLASSSSISLILLCGKISKSRVRRKGWAAYLGEV